MPCAPLRAASSAELRYQSTAWTRSPWSKAWYATRWQASGAFLAVTPAEALDLGTQLHQEFLLQARQAGRGLARPAVHQRRRDQTGQRAACCGQELAASHVLATSARVQIGR